MPVQSLQTEAEIELFARFPEEIHGHNPNWRGEDTSFVQAQVTNQSPWAEHTRAQCFAVLENGVVQAQACAVVDTTYNRYWKERAGSITHFDVRPGSEAAGEDVLSAACEWLKAQDCDFVRCGFLPGWQMPFPIDAYDVPPTTWHCWCPPYYHHVFKNARFAVEKGMVEYRVSFNEELRERYKQFVKACPVSLRHWDIAKDAGQFRTLMNETFGRHWGFPPFTADECSGLAGAVENDLPKYGFFAEDGSEPAGFVFSFPDINQGPNPSHGVLLIIGVRESYRGRGINLALGARSYLAMMEYGLTSASYTVVLDENWPSRRTAEKLGCRVERNFVTYRRDLFAH